MKNSGPYYPHIDGLRAVAVIAVVLYHLSQKILPSGLMGVDIFFVISGFVVTTSILNFEGSFAQFVSSFYSRRFVRILPNLLLVIGITTIASVLFIPAFNFGEFARAAHFGIENLVLKNQQANYFSHSTEYNPFTHIWSLGVEEQFYLVFPLMIFPWLQQSRIGRGMPFIIAGLCAASALSTLYVSDPVEAFYYPFFRAWELGVGVLACILLQKQQVKEALSLVSGRTWFRWLGNSLFVIILASLGTSSSSTFPNPLNAIAVFATAALLLALAQDTTSFAYRVLSHPTARYLGTLSYAIYLIHWPVLVLLRWTFGLDEAVKVGAAIALILAFSALSFRLIEIPSREIRRRLRPAWILVIGVALVILSSHQATWLFNHRSEYTLAWAARDLSLWGGNAEVDSEECREHENSDVENRWIFERDGTCSKTTSSPKLFVLGDSHASNYTNLLRKLKVDDGRSITLYAHGGCTYLNLTKPFEEGTRTCLDFFAESIKDLKKTASRGDILFIPGLRINRVSDWFELYGSDEPLTAKSDPTEARAAIDSAITQLKPFLDLGMEVVFEAPKPLYKAPVFRCVDWFNRSNPLCSRGIRVSRTELLRYRAPVMEAMKTVQAKLGPQLHIFDPFTSLCPENAEDQCSAVLDGKPIFIDQDHLSAYGAVSLYPSFKSMLDQLGSRQSAAN